MQFWWCGCVVWIRFGVACHCHASPSDTSASAPDTHTTDHAVRQSPHHRKSKPGDLSSEARKMYYKAASSLYCTPEYPTKPSPGAQPGIHILVKSPHADFTAARTTLPLRPTELTSSDASVRIRLGWYSLPGLPPTHFNQEGGSSTTNHLPAIPPKSPSKQPPPNLHHAGQQPTFKGRTLFSFLQSTK